MTATADRVSTTVVDNPAYAWRNSADRIKNRLFARLDADFVHDYESQLHAAATALLGPVLVVVWQEHGYQVTFGPDGDAMLRRPKDVPWYRVWDEAVTRLKPHAVVIKARLDDELLRYSAAHPRTEQLARDCAALRQCSQHLRAELHDRLDTWATNTSSPRADAQIDGWRAAIDTAVTRSQLDHLASQIPA